MSLKGLIEEFKEPNEWAESAKKDNRPYTLEERWWDFTTKLDNMWFEIMPIHWIYRLPHNLFEDWPREVKWAWQRVFTGYDERIYWSLDSYLGPMILKHLQNFQKEDKNGYPVTIWEKDSKMDDNFNMTDGSPDPNIAAWDQILADMVERWEYMVNHDDHWDKILEEFGDVRKPEETFMGYKMDHKKWNDKCSEEMNKKNEEMFAKASLFVKHFWGLWD